MGKKFFNRIYYRAAGTIVTTLTKGGTYPAYTFSGWTLLVGEMEGAKMSIEDDGKAKVDGGATEYVPGEKIPIEIMVTNFTAANLATIRSAFKNVKLDVLLVDSDQPDVAYAAFGVRLYPKVDFPSGEDEKIILSGERKFGSGVSTAPFQTITVS
jgi:hypothetical protein